MSLFAFVAFINSGFMETSLLVFTLLGIVEFMFAAIFLVVTFLVLAVVELVLLVVVILVGLVVISSGFRSLLVALFVTKLSALGAFLLFVMLSVLVLFIVAFLFVTFLLNREEIPLETAGLGVSDSTNLIVVMRILFLIVATLLTLLETVIRVITLLALRTFGFVMIGPVLLTTIFFMLLLMSLVTFHRHQ